MVDFDEGCLKGSLPLIRSFFKYTHIKETNYWLLSTNGFHQIYILFQESNIICFSGINPIPYLLWRAFNPIFLPILYSQVFGYCGQIPSSSASNSLSTSLLSFIKFTAHTLLCYWLVYEPRTNSLLWHVNVHSWIPLFMLYSIGWYSYVIMILLFEISCRIYNSI